MEVLLPGIGFPLQSRLACAKRLVVVIANRAINNLIFILFDFLEELIILQFNDVKAILQIIANHFLGTFQLF